MSKVAVGPGNVGRLLLAASERSKNLSIGLARLLVSPNAFFFTVPQLGLREILTTIRVADLVATTLLQNRSQSVSEGFDALSSRWRVVRLRLFAELRNHLRNHPPLGTREVRNAINVFERLPNYSEPIRRDLEQLCELLNLQEERWERLGLTRSPWANERRRPRRGNRFSEHHQRIVAAIEFLKSTHYQKEQDALQLVSELLSEYGLRRRPDSLRKLCDRYQAAHSANRTGYHVSPTKLPATWFDGQLGVSLGSYLLWYCRVQEITLRECLKKIASP